VATSALRDEVKECLDAGDYACDYDANLAPEVLQAAREAEIDRYMAAAEEVDDDA
jgi:hypothetical protein